MWPRFWIAACWVLLGTAAFALTVDTPLPDPAQEARAKALFQEIRCVVCQGETIADSPSAVASDLRRDIRTRIAQGDSDEAIRSTLSTRYGDSILMRPPFNLSTLPLWAGPLIILVLGLWLARHYFRDHRI